jgi:hypothetical protein
MTQAVECLLYSTKPWVQTPVPPKKKKKKRDNEFLSQTHNHYYISENSRKAWRCTKFHNTSFVLSRWMQSLVHYFRCKHMIFCPKTGDWTTLTEFTRHQCLTYILIHNFKTYVYMCGTHVYVCIHTYILDIYLKSIKWWLLRSQTQMLSMPMDNHDAMRVHQGDETMSDRRRLPWSKQCHWADI